MNSEEKLINDIKINPGTEFENKLLGLLRGKNTFRRKRHFPWLSAAALIIGFGMGHFFGIPDTEKTQKQFVLLLHTGEHMTGTEEEHVREYGAWADMLNSKHALVAGEKLADAFVVLGREKPLENTSIGGYFIIQAENEDLARNLALTCPHLKYGGWIELRMIEPT